VVLRLSSPVNATLDGDIEVTTLDATGTITDDDAAPSSVTLTVDADTGMSGVQDSVAEGGGAKTVQVTATLVGDSRFLTARTVVLTVGKATDSAVEGTDYAAVADFAVTIPAGAASASGTFSLDPTDDDIDENSETISVTGTAGDLEVTGTTVTVTDDDTAAIVLMPDSIEIPMGEQRDYEVALSSEPSGTVTVAIEKPADSYMTHGPSELEFTPSNWMQPQTVTVTANGDPDGDGVQAQDDGDGMISMVILHTGQGNEYQGLRAEMPVVMLTDSPPPEPLTISVDDAQGPEGSWLEFRVHLSQPSPGGVEVKYHTTSGEAWGLRVPRDDGDWNERDYDTVDGILRFDLGEQEKMVRVWARADDGMNDPGETFFFDIYDPLGATLANPNNVYPLPLTPEVMGQVGIDGGRTWATSNISRAIGTITGAMPAPLEVSISVDRDVVTEGDDHRTIIKVTATAPYGADRSIRIPLTCLGDTAEPEDFACPTGLTIHRGDDYGQAGFEVRQDDDAEDETFMISFGNLPVEAMAGTPASVMLTVLDDDAPVVDSADDAAVDPKLALIDRVKAYAAEKEHGEEHVKRWRRVLYVLTGGKEGTSPAMTALEAQTYADRGWVRWIPVVAAIQDIEQRDGSPYQGLTVSIADATAREGTEDLWFEITLNRPAPGPVTLRAESEWGTARSPNDYQLLSREIRFETGERMHRLPVWVHDDDIDEGSETMTVVLSSPQPSMVAFARDRATGTIENSDPLPAAWLARFGRTVAQQALDGIADRMEAPRTSGMAGKVAGQDLFLATVGDGWPPSGPGDFAGGYGNDVDGSGESYGGLQTMTMREILFGSSFTLTGAPDRTGGSLAFWGRAAEGRFDGREDTLSLDGEVTTALFGADYARDRWLLGLALAHSKGDGSYAGGATGPDCADDPDAAACDAARTGDGKVEGSLDAVIPYASMQTSERLRLWAATGYGRGRLMLETMEERYRADTRWTMAAAGMRSDLLAPPDSGSGVGAGSHSRPELALTADALWVRTASEKVAGLAASDTGVTRFRLGLEGIWHIALESEDHAGAGSGASLVPRLELGARYDGGDAETGLGLELGGGLAWNAPALGLTLDLSGRTLIAHEDDDFEDRGLSVAFTFDPTPDTARGPSFSLRQDFGDRAEGGLDALFESTPLEDRTGSEPQSRWTLEGAWGVPALDGRFTASTHAELGLGADSRDYTLGWRLTPEANTAPNLTFGLKATRREGTTQSPEHTIGVEVILRW